MTDDAGCLRSYAETRYEAAFSEFVRRNVDLVYSVAFRQTGGDGHLAEDVVQTVFEAAVQKASILGRHPVVGRGCIKQLVMRLSTRCVRVGVSRYGR